MQRSATSWSGRKRGFFPRFPLSPFMSYPSTPPPFGGDIPLRDIASWHAIVVTPCSYQQPRRFLQIC